MDFGGGKSVVPTPLYETLGVHMRLSPAHNGYVATLTVTLHHVINVHMHMYLVLP